MLVTESSPVTAHLVLSVRGIRHGKQRLSATRSIANLSSTARQREAYYFRVLPCEQCSHQLLSSGFSCRLVFLFFNRLRTHTPSFYLTSYCTRASRIPGPTCQLTREDRLRIIYYPSGGQLGILPQWRERSRQTPCSARRLRNTSRDRMGRQSRERLASTAYRKKST